MPNENAIVSTSIQFNLEGDQAADRTLREGQSVDVELDDGRRARLTPEDPRSVGFAALLYGIHREQRPVYLEVDPGTQAITRILVPHVARVIDISRAAGAIEVTLDESHARHFLPAEATDAEEVEGALRGAHERRTQMIITEDDQHRIIDVRDFRGPEGGRSPFVRLEADLDVQPPPRLAIWRILDWLWRYISMPFWWWFRCLPPAQAQLVFDSMAATSCAPLTVPSPCIPFLYPDDGCWARAHEMCRLMIGMGLSPKKVWIDGNLHVATRNNPQCMVYWGWHVAPTLCVRGTELFSSQRMVIDPSLFTTPVTEAAWMAVQGDPAATLTDTSADQYSHGGGTDPTYSDTNSRLAFYRLQLQARAVQVGPPPYAMCP